MVVESCLQVPQPEDMCLGALAAAAAAAAKKCDHQCERIVYAPNSQCSGMQEWCCSAANGC
jgi:hypothetical protein